MTVGLLTAISVFCLWACDPALPNVERQRVFYSPVLKVDGIYKSMQGPIGSIIFDLNRAWRRPPDPHGMSGHM